jgi:hypothetical protein
MSLPSIIIRQQPAGAGFSITLDPAPAWADFDRERPTHRAARRYAEGLRTVHGWKIRDESEGVS